MRFLRIARNINISPNKPKTIQQIIDRRIDNNNVAPNKTWKNNNKYAPNKINTACARLINFKTE
jgi:hypothetical protein